MIIDIATGVVFAVAVLYILYKFDKPAVTEVEDASRACLADDIYDDEAKAENLLDTPELTQNASSEAGN